MELDIGSNATELINNLATQLGMTAEQVFPWFVKSAYISAATGLLLAPICWLLAYLCYRISKWGYTHENYDATVPCGMDVPALGGAIAAGLLGVIATIVTVLIPDMITTMLCPEVQALKDIAAALRGM